MTRRHSFATTLLLILATACSTDTRPTVTSTTTRPPVPLTTTTTVPTTTTTTTTTLPPSTTTRPVVPNPTVTPSRSNASTACPPEIVAAIRRNFDRFGADVADWMIGIVWRESNCRPDVVSPTGCYGLTQTALPLHDRFYEALGVDWRTTWMDPDTNLAAAALLYEIAGPGPWRL